MNHEDLSDLQLERYSRQILLHEIDINGQQKLLNATITVVGGGGLGCAALQVLAGAGIGHLRVIDGDRIDLSNLPRQTLHSTSDIGQFKVDSIKRKLLQLNPDIEIKIHPARLTKTNAKELLDQSDVILDATDNIGTKFLVNDVAVHLGIPVTIAAVVQYGGHVLSVDPGKSGCFRCLFDVPAVDPKQFSCTEAGIFATAAMFGGLVEAHEAIRTILNLEGRLLNQILTFDFKRSYELRIIPFPRDPQCKACNNPTIAFWKKADYG